MTSQLPPHKPGIHALTPLNVHPISAGARRFKYGLNVSVLILALVVILVVVNWLAADSHMRWDFTATRAYSLSPQTRALLKALAQPIEITLLFSEEQAGPLRRQVEDVLREFTKRSDQVTIKKIDPLDPRSITPYEELLSQLENTYAGEIANYETQISQARSELETTSSFLQEQGGLLAGALQSVPAKHQFRRLFESIYVALGTLPYNTQSFTAQADRMLEKSAVQPMPDWEGAAVALKQALQGPGQTFQEIAKRYRDVIASGDIPAGLEDLLPDWATRFDTAGQQALDAAQKLDDLEPLGLTAILRSIQKNNCVLVSTSNKATSISSEQLFPRPNAREIQEGTRFDLRFAGEGIVASAIRRLLQTTSPTVVFCNAFAQPGMVLGGFRQPGMVSELAKRLNDLGFETVEWNVMTGEKPVLSSTDAPVVYVIIPPEPSMSDQQAMTAAASLSKTVEDLVNDGQNVFFNFYPSFIPGFGQSDVWASVAQHFGVTPDTGRVIFERIPQPGSQDRYQPAMLLNDYNADSVIGKALVGLDTQLIYPIPLKLDDSAPPSADAGEQADPSSTTNKLPENLQRWVVLQIQPSDRIWAEDQWFNQQTIAPPDVPDTDPYPVVVASEVSSPANAQRALFVGSGNWFINDVVNSMSLIDNNIWPTNPGNAELFLSGVCWLAGLDDSIAPSPMTRSISRISPMSDDARMAYRWGLAIGLPIVVLAAGVSVWFARRG